MNKLVIFVKATKPSITLLRFIDKNLAKITATGVVLSVEKVSNSASSQECKRRKITSLPAMIDTRGKVHIGAEKIIQIFKDNIGQPRTDDPIAGLYGTGENGPEEQTNAWIARHMFRQNDKGDMEPIVTDGDSDDGEGRDFEDKWEEARRKTGRGGRRSSLPAPRRGKKHTKRRRARTDSDSDGDDAGSDDDGEVNVARARADDDFQEDIREQMKRAWHEDR